MAKDCVLGHCMIPQYESLLSTMVSLWDVGNEWHLTGTISSSPFTPSLFTLHTLPLHTPKP